MPRAVTARVGQQIRDRPEERALALHHDAVHSPSLLRLVVRNRPVQQTKSSNAPTCTLMAPAMKAKERTARTLLLSIALPRGTKTTEMPDVYLRGKKIPASRLTAVELTHHYTER